MKRLVIVNPHCRSGRGGRAFAKLKPSLEARWGRIEHHETTGPGDATERVRSALREGDCDQIVVAGGDGTVNEAVNGYFENGRLVSREVPLAIVDLGTGGDFFRTVREESENYEEAVEANRFALVDCGRVTAGGPERRFLNIASAGLAGEMLRRMRASRFRGGAAGYFWHTAASLLAHEPLRVEIAGGGRRREAELINLFACNGRSSGGGMRWAPDASLRDGRLAVTLIEGRRKWPLIAQSRKLYAGRIDEFPGATRWRAEELVLRAADELSLEADGESLERAKEVHFSVEAGVFPLVM